MRKFFGLLGLIVGALFGFLFAPRKGKEFRAQLKKEWREDGSVKETLTEQAHNFGSEVGKTFHELKEMPEVQHTLERGKQQIRSYAEEAAELGSEQAGVVKKKLWRIFSHWQKKIKRVR